MTGDTMSAYFLGTSLSIACQMDQRFSYRTYAPKALQEEGPAHFRLLVAVHSTARDQDALLAHFTAFAEEHKLIILAPLFPAGVIDPADRDNYKYIDYEGIRFDRILLSMVDEVTNRYGIDTERFGLFGFSGGAHFAHRFFYLHPSRLSAVSVAAPGSVTLLDESRDWWVGTRNTQERFGITIDHAALRQVPVHLTVGADDVSTKEIHHTEASKLWMPGANDTGNTRIERLRTLHDNLLENGIDSTFEIVPAVGHAAQPLIKQAQTFFVKHFRHSAPKAAS